MSWYYFILTKVVQGVKESAFYHSIVKNIDNITEFVTKLQKNLYKNAVTLKQEKDELVEKVKSKHSKIASHLNKLEKNHLRQIDSTITKESQQITEAASYLQKKIHILNEYKRSTHFYNSWKCF